MLGPKNSVRANMDTLSIWGPARGFSFHFLFPIHENLNIIGAWPIVKSNSTSFISANFFLRVHNKKVTKRGSGEPHSNCLESEDSFPY